MTEVNSCEFPSLYVGSLAKEGTVLSDCVMKPLHVGTGT